MPVSKKPSAGLHFSGEGADDDSNSAPLSSASLLAKIKARNHISKLSSQGTAAEEDEEEEVNGLGASGTSTPPAPPTEHDELLVDLRNFVAFQANVDGEATTQEVLEYFKPRLSQKQAPVFRELLRSICDFHRTSGQEGIWRLKEHFRWKKQQNYQEKQNVHLQVSYTESFILCFNLWKYTPNLIQQLFNGALRTIFRKACLLYKHEMVKVKFWHCYTRLHVFMFI